MDQEPPDRREDQSRLLTCFFAFAKQFATFVHAAMYRRSAIHFNVIAVSRRNRAAIFTFFPVAFPPAF